MAHCLAILMAPFPKAGPARLPRGAPCTWGGRTVRTWTGLSLLAFAAEPQPPVPTCGSTAPRQRRAGGGRGTPKPEEAGELVGWTPSGSRPLLPPPGADNLLGDRSGRVVRYRCQQPLPRPAANSPTGMGEGVGRSGLRLPSNKQGRPSVRPPSSACLRRERHLVLMPCSGSPMVSCGR